MNLAGCGQEELHRLLWALGYKPLEAKDPETAEKVTVYVRSQKAIVAKRQREQRSEEHTSELQSLMRISYAVFCLKKKNTETHRQKHATTSKINNKKTKERSTLT